LTEAFERGTFFRPPTTGGNWSFAMYAVIETGGKQYRVEPGDVIEIERLDGSPSAASEESSSVEFDRVLMVRDDDAVKIGDPTVAGATVTGVPVGDVRAPKLVVFKMKRRKGYRRRRGHRQDLLQVRIDEIKS
jgi:large subunit ribosomal protein L21